VRRPSVPSRNDLHCCVPCRDQGRRALDTSGRRGIGLEKPKPDPAYIGWVLKLRLVPIPDQGPDAHTDPWDECPGGWAHKGPHAATWTWGGGGVNVNVSTLSPDGKSDETNRSPVCAAIGDVKDSR
jgi:hypothetical protein